MDRLTIVGITRIRNEAEIIEDTIRHAEAICDALVVYDDASTDNTIERVRRHARKPVEIIAGKTWLSDRPAEETRHRHLVHEVARGMHPEWIFCFDADERFEDGLRDLLLSPAARDQDGVRIRLFDAYLSPVADAPYTPGQPLATLERLYGPERRDILMAWRPSPLFLYEGLDLREPRVGAGARILLSDICCKHFGKGISVEQWESTCDYYATHFPEPYRTKWTQRRGKALHERSDFGTPLYRWEDVRSRGIRVHP